MPLLAEGRRPVEHVGSRCLGSVGSVVEPRVLVEVVRSGFVESHHRGSVVALAEDGSVGWSIGDVVSPVYPRSCNKPVQAVGMLRAGLDLDGAPLALAAASHSGEPFHLDGVRAILAGAGLDESALQTPPDYPLDDDAKVAFVRAGQDKASIAMNCSGKHAAMLATCVAAGWSTDSYRDPGHPLQRALAATFAELTGEAIASTGVDGCGAPLFSTSLTGLARAFSRIVRGGSGTPERRVADAIVGYPEYASGTRRDEAALLRAVPGAVGKAGAEACYAVALPDGRAVALKIDDGYPRARPVVMAEALRRLGIDDPAVDATGVVRLYGGDEPVGELRPVF
jgi:L-asparaginase II